MGGEFTKNDPRINRNGRPKKENCVTDLLKQKLPPDEFAEIVAKEARSGNDSIIRHVYDRYEGKVPDKHEITGEDGEDIKIEVVIEDIADKDSTV